ncbi:MAG: transposase [Halothiobacillaceae bacterium]|nr:transposase [Halothiobacillaceae bacterium]
MGKRGKRERQGDLWVATGALVETPGHAFYDRLNEVLRHHRFDERVEHLCGRYYQGPRGRPSMPPGVYFRMLLVGYFEGLGSERGIAWRVADSLSLRKFLGYGLDEKTPDHSTLSRTRRLYWLSTHQAVFGWVLKVLASEGLVGGETVSIDATTLEANAAMRSIVRRDTGEKYEQYLKQLAKEGGLEDPTREELARFDRKRKKKGSNQDWKHPKDPDARITKMKDGRTHLAHKAEHAVDLTSGALLAVTLQPADVGDTTTVFETLDAAEAAVQTLVEGGIKDVVLDKGYHSNEALVRLNELGKRGYVSEPDRGRRRWEGKEAEQKQVYANRRRLRGERNKRLQKKRTELGERSFAHLYETGGMRRLHLRGRDNILKRLLVHGAGFNLGLFVRASLGAGKPRQFQGRSGLLGPFIALISRLLSTYRPSRASLASLGCSRVLIDRHPRRLPPAIPATVAA